MNKNIIKITFISLLLIITFSRKGYAQATTDFVFVESTVEDVHTLEQQFANNSNVYFNSNPKPALYVFGQICDNRMVDQLFIYVPTEPGVIKFGSGDITLSTIDDYANELAFLAEHVSGSIIFRSADVFSGSAGESLKEKLESLSGLSIIMEENPQPFSN
nr:DUF4347 domain-containing protein [uncultured Draconibacterium sp.]